MKFTKMQGLGNDYIYINCLDHEIDNPHDLAIKLSDRHFSIGADGIVLIKKSNVADFRMQMFNADGSEAEMCGNATRCIARYVFEKGLTKKTTITLETLAGIMHLTLNFSGNTIESVTVDMGEPILKSSLIPVNSTLENFINQKITLDDELFNITCVSMGNPHTVVYVNDVNTFPVSLVGSKIEHHPLFPKRTNVEFVQVVDKSTLKMRVWERGSGETLACGTGACASLVASVLNNVSDNIATLKLLGGNLTIQWDQSSNHVYMTGPCEFVFEGEI
ncbi:MAG: diaminopimelate epimerase [Clostridiales bacterium]|nr:diaminopimelate epimerase [Clostridiales bacterium]